MPEVRRAGAAVPALRPAPRSRDVPVGGAVSAAGLRAVKALTVHQPWAGLIAAGCKTAECRSWPPPPSLVGGDLAIHAAKRRAAARDGALDALAALEARHRRALGLAYGCVVAVVRRVEAWRVVYVGGSGWADDVKVRSLDGKTMRFVRPDGWGDWSPGVWLWTWEAVDRLDPVVPARGRQGVWDWRPPFGPLEMWTA